MMQTQLDPSVLCEPGPGPRRIEDTGVDWITVTGKDGEQSELLQATAETIGREVMGEGTPLRPWAWWGYSGFAGGGLEWGRRWDGVMVRLHGSTAQRWWSWVYWPGRSVTRLDVQTTVDLGRVDHDWGSIQMGRALSARPRQGRPAAVDGILNQGKLRTLFLGKRSSDRYARLYDKGHESGLYPPGRFWRYEVEFKRLLAERAADRLWGEEDPGSRAVGMVDAEFRSRGVPLPVAADSHPRICGRRDMPTQESRLLYLRTTVRPMIRKLMDAGLAAEVYRALELPRATPIHGVTIEQRELDEEE